MNVDRLVLTDAFEELLRRVRLVVDADVRGRAAQARVANEHPVDTLRLLGRAGLLGLTVPEDLGGEGCSYYDYLQIVEELATVWPELALSVCSHDSVCHTMSLAGSHDQREHWLQDMISGRMVADRVMVQMSVSDRLIVRNSASKESSGHYVLAGNDLPDSTDPGPDVYAVLARTREHDGHSPLAWCILAAPPTASRAKLRALDDRRPGLEPLSRGSLRVPSRDSLRMDAALVHDSQVLAELSVAAVATGVAQAALDAALLSLRHAQTGLTGREPAASLVVADIAAVVESSRAAYLSAARFKDCGMPFGKQAVAAALVATSGATAATTVASRLVADAADGPHPDVDHLALQSSVVERRLGDTKQLRLRLMHASTRAWSAPAEYAR